MLRSGSAVLERARGRGTREGCVLIKATNQGVVEETSGGGSGV